MRPVGGPEPRRARHNADQAVIVEFKLDATQRSVWAGIAPTGNRMVVQATCIFVFGGAGLVYQKVYFDYEPIRKFQRARMTMQNMKHLLLLGLMLLSAPAAAAEQKIDDAEIEAEIKRLHAFDEKEKAAAAVAAEKQERWGNKTITFKAGPWIKWRAALDDTCQRGPANSQATWLACGKRDVLEQMLWETAKDEPAERWFKAGPAIEWYAALDKHCQGDPGNARATWVVCGKRDVLGQILRGAGVEP